MEQLFQYAAKCERHFEKQLEMTGYTRISTFYAGLSIAECGGADAIRDTYKRVMKSWIGDVKMITEFVMCLNYKCWEHYERFNNELANLYGRLFDAARDKVYTHYEGNEDAVAYIWRTLD